MTIRHGLAAFLTAGSAVLALGACGGGSNGDGTAGKVDDTKALAFAQCMRKAGLDFPDPKPGGGPQAIRIPTGISPERLQRIQQACARKTGGGPHEPSKAEQAKFRDQALKFARCMRAHGVNIPDPQVGGGGIQISKRAGGPGAGPTSLDPKSPVFQRAQTACSSLMPGGKDAKGGALAMHSAGSAGGKGDKPRGDAVIVTGP